MQLAVKEHLIKLSKSGFEPLASGVECDRTANRATATALDAILLPKQNTNVLVSKIYVIRYGIRQSELFCTTFEEARILCFP